MPTKTQELAYMRNGVLSWPVEKQRQALAKAGFAGPVYEDILSRAQMRGRDPKHLINRMSLFHPTGRQAPKIVIVASIRVLAMSPVDLMGVLAQAAARQATVLDLDTGLQIAPNAGAAEYAAATSAWDKARKGDQTRNARTKGNEAAVTAARRRTAKAIAIAKPLWGLPSDEISGPAIAKRAGVSIATLYNKLGPRRSAQKRANKLKKGKPDA